jgi:hypothetical protein
MQPVCVELLYLSKIKNNARDVETELHKRFNELELGRKHWRISGMGLGYSSNQACRIDHSIFETKNEAGT